MWNIVDPSVDKIKTAGIPVLKKFLVDDEVILEISHRGAVPVGLGKVHFKCPTSRYLKSIQVIFKIYFSHTQK